MAEAIAADARRRSRAGVPGVLGIHLEGPFLNPERKGVHDPAFMRPIEEADIALVTSLGAGQDACDAGAGEGAARESIARLAQAGVDRLRRPHRRRLRHDRARRARPGSPASPISSTPCRRSPAATPGPVGAALDDPEAWCGLIVDLHPRLGGRASASPSPRKGWRAHDAGHRRHAVGRLRPDELRLCSAARSRARTAG